MSDSALRGALISDFNIANLAGLLANAAQVSDRSDIEHVFLEGSVSARRVKIGAAGQDRVTAGVENFQGVLKLGRAFVASHRAISGHSH